MFDFRQDERTFWKTMNPARLHALFAAYDGLNRDQAAASAEKPVEMSLSAYLMGGA